MASTPSGTVTQGNLVGNELLFTDTGSYGTVSSRILNIYDYQGNLIQTYNMGANLTQIFPIPADNWYWFVCTVTDNISGSPWVTNVYYVSTGYYWTAYQAQFDSTNCGCGCNNYNMEISNLLLQAALRFNLAGLSGASSAQQCIVAANFFINQSVTSQLS